MGFEDVLYLFRTEVKNRNFVRLNLGEAGLLFRTAKRSTGNVLEIGTKIGGSAVLMAEAIGADRRVYSVDLISHTSQKAHKKGAKGRNLNAITSKSTLKRIDFIVGESTAVAKKWEELLGLVFVDGDHAPESLLKDIRAWSRHVKPGGYMAFHDIGGISPGKSAKDIKEGFKLRQTLEKLVYRELPTWEKTGHVQSLLVLRKPEL